MVYIALGVIAAIAVLGYSVFIYRNYLKNEKIVKFLQEELSLAKFIYNSRVQELETSQHLIVKSLINEIENLKNKAVVVDLPKQEDVIPVTKVRKSKKA